MMKKNTLRRIIIIFFVIVIVFCAAIIKKALSKTDKIYEVADTSDAVYCTNHFDENCLGGVQYIACNGDKMVYVDGLNLYRLSDHQVILENVQIRKMLYTDYYLYVLDDKNAFHVIDMESLITYEVQGVNDFYYDKMSLAVMRACGHHHKANAPHGDDSRRDNVKIYIDPTEFSGLYGVDETSIIKNGAVVPFDQMEDVDPVVIRDMKDRIYDDNGYCYWANCDRFEVSVCRKEVEGTLDEKDGILLNDDYKISKNNLSIDGEDAYLLYQIHVGQTTYKGTQKETYCDGILKLDFDKEKTITIYETDNNLSRIVGFDSAKNYVYLYDVNGHRIQEVNLDTNQQTTICTLDNKYNTLFFEMGNDVIFIYTDNNQLVQIVELK